MRVASTPICRNCPIAEGMAPQKNRPGSRCRLAADERRSRRVQDAFGVGQERAQVRAEAGRENDRVEAFGGRLFERDALAGEACDLAAKHDPSVADRSERADVDERHAPILLNGLDRPLGRAPQAELFDRADRESDEGRVDRVGYARRQPSFSGGIDEDRQSEQFARHDVDRAAHRERNVEARFGEVERDLAPELP